MRVALKQQPKLPPVADGTPVPHNLALVPSRVPAVAKIGERVAQTASPECKFDPAAGNAFAADWALEDYLRRAGFETMDLRAACRKMDSLARHQHKRWGWYSLRPQDCGGVTNWPHAYEVGYDRNSAGAIINGHLVDEVYPLAMPESAWALVGQIDRGFPGRVRFLVSHYGVRMPDPFLAVTATGRELYVIAEWLRPGRRVPLTRRPTEPLGLPIKFWAFLAVLMVVLWRVL